MKKISTILLTIFAIGVIVTLFAGGASVLGYIVAMVIGGDAVSFDLSTFSTLLGYAQLIVAAGSIVMIFVNIKRYPDEIRKL